MRAQRPLRNHGANEVGDFRLRDMRLAAVDRLDAGGVDVVAVYAEPARGKEGCGRETDIAETDDGRREFA